MCQLRQCPIAVFQVHWLSLISFHVVKRPKNIPLGFGPWVGIGWPNAKGSLVVGQALRAAGGESDYTYVEFIFSALHISSLQLNFKTFILRST